MNILYRTVYIFLSKECPKITLMKVEREKGKTQNYVMDGYTKEWSKISMREFNSLNLAYIGNFIGTIENANTYGEIELHEYPYPMCEIVQGGNIINVKNLEEARRIRDSMCRFIVAKKR